MASRSKIMGWLLIIVMIALIMAIKVLAAERSPNEWFALAVEIQRDIEQADFEHRSGGSTYLSFDVDSLDPVYAPGTGTPQPGGLTTLEAQRLIRDLGGLDFVGAELVEVSPPFDTGGITSMTAATVLFELLCVLAQARAQRKPMSRG